MRKKLFRKILISLILVFVLSYGLGLYFYGINPLTRPTESISLIFFFGVLLPIIANELTYRILTDSLKPVDKFLKFITDIILGKDYKSEEEFMDIEKDLMDYMENYDHNSKEIIEGVIKLRESEQIRKEFSANVTHELKTPLTSINGYAEMIAQGMTNLEEAREFAQIINKEGNRLLNMIDETIQLSKFDNNYVKTEAFEIFNLGELIEENIESLSHLAEEKKMIISFNQTEVLFYGNRKLIDDLVRNLISNAIKYSKEENAYLDINLFDSFDHVEIIFTDNGIGIGPEDQKRVFERFFTVDKARSKKSGTGLGLSLVKHIALMHKGSVRLESRLGIGSTFYVSLPKLTDVDYENKI